MINMAQTTTTSEKTTTTKLDLSDPPAYLNGSIAKEKSTIYHSEEKQSFSGQDDALNAAKSYKMVIANQCWSSNYKVFVSQDSFEKFKTFKKTKKEKKSNEITIPLQSEGVGIPLFKVQAHCWFGFLTFYKCFPSVDKSAFDIAKDKFEFCKVKKHTHVGYDSFVFEFTPDPENRSSDFTLTLFSSGVFPINDYEYNGKRYRWVDESRCGGVTKQVARKFAFTHTVLQSNQPSMLDNWDGKNHSLDKQKGNPLLDGLLKKRFKWGTKKIKEEYYGENDNTQLSETVATCLKLGYAMLQTESLHNNNACEVNQESILSVNLDVLVMVCFATVLKRKKDIVEQANIAAAAAS